MIWDQIKEFWRLVKAGIDNAIWIVDRIVELIDVFVRPRYCVIHRPSLN